MKFNVSIKGTSATINREGARAYQMTPELELYAAVTTTMLSDVTYEQSNERLKRIQALIQQVNPLFAARLAVYARRQMNLRTAPVVLATELAKVHRGDSLVSNTIEQIVQRPDEIMEVLAYYQATNNRTATKKLNRISKQVQKGLAASFNKFDEYQFAKYDRDATVKLRDALFLVHPKAKDEAQQDLFNKIVNKELKTPYTWETELSALGQTLYDNNASRQDAIKAKWEELIDSRRMGYMATLRNLRNILEANVSAAHIKQVYDYLSDEKAILNSKQLPFRFLAAYRELKGVKNGHTSYILEALEKAVTLSVANMTGFDLETRVVIACDVSGSMQKAISPKSKILLYDIALLLGMILQSKCKNVLTGMFGDTWKTVALPAKNILSNVDAFYAREGEVGYATNGFLVLKDLVDRKYVADKVMLFTDLQLWDSKTNNATNQNTMTYQWAVYKKIAPNAKLYLFDLAGYGQSPLSTLQNDVHLIAGWSDKIFEVMEAMENGENAIERIQQVVL